MHINVLDRPTSTGNTAAAEFVRSNVDGSQALLEAYVAGGVKRVVYGTRLVVRGFSAEPDRRLAPTELAEVDAA
jgi:nucleoside-diphosphate-sugar epimerase